MIDSKLAINTIKESCYRVGYPNDTGYERRKLINQSCDYAIDCINKLKKIEEIVNYWDTTNILPENDWKYISEIQNVLENKTEDNDMAKVVDFEKNMEHEVSEVICLKCLNRWVAVYPSKTPLKQLECKCGSVGYVIKTGQTLEEQE